MVEVTNKQFDVVEDAVGKYCLDCPEDTTEDDSACKNCHVRRLMDSLIVTSGESL